MNFSGINWKSVLTPSGLKSILVGCTEAIKIKAETATDLVKTVAEHRRDMICANCDLNVDDQCDTGTTGQVIQDFTYHNQYERKIGDWVNGCGCNLLCKTANLSEQCPLGKWLEVAH